MHDPPLTLAAWTLDTINSVRDLDALEAGPLLREDAQPGALERDLEEFVETERRERAQGRLQRAA